MADLTKQSDQALQQEIDRGRKTVSTLGAVDISPQEARAGKGDAVLAEMHAAVESVNAARAELARRSKANDNYLQASAMHAQRQVQMDAWALDPTPMHERERERGRHLEPNPYEAALKSFHLLRNSLPPGWEVEELDASKLTAPERRELHDLVLRGRKGGGALDVSGVERMEELLEIAGDRPVGSIRAQAEFLEQREAEERQRAAAYREAESRSETERQRHLASLGIRR